MPLHGRVSDVGWAQRWAWSASQLVGMLLHCSQLANRSAWHVERGWQQSVKARPVWV